MGAGRSRARRSGPAVVYPDLAPARPSSSPCAASGSLLAAYPTKPKQVCSVSSLRRRRWCHWSALRSARQSDP